MTDRKFAWIRDVKDARDYIMRPKIGPLRTHVYPLMRGVVRIEDQGSLGSCTGQSCTAAVEIAMGWKSRQLSRLMAYYNGRELEDNIPNDDGAQIRDVIKGHVTTGVSAESWWPYKTDKFAKRPTLFAYMSAARTRMEIEKAGVTYQRVQNLQGVLAALNADNPVVFGFMVLPALQCVGTSILRLPQQNDKFLGGHAVVAVGYNLPERYVWVQNSWGKEWGIGGYFRMEMGYFDNPQWCDDMWMVTRRK